VNQLLAWYHHGCLRRCRMGVLSISLLLLSATPSIASPYTEKPGFKDHPVVSRFQGSILVNAGAITFEHVDIPVGPTQHESVEGKIFNYFYVAPNNRGDLEVYRSFQQALQAGGFKILYACEDSVQCQRQNLVRHAQRWTGEAQSFAGGYSSISYMGDNGNYPPRYLVGRLSRAEGDLLAVLTVHAPSSVQRDNQVGSPYFLQIIETAAMQIGAVTVTADALLKGLTSEGHMALYEIYFDTGKSTIKPESTSQLDEMANLLTTNPTLNVYIVGHTDNQGSLETNLTLSQQRADAVVKVLIDRYKIAKSRLVAKGVANFSPVASNTSDHGRAKNRRVELVAQ